MQKELTRFHAPDRQTWRNWLIENHASAAGVWLIYFKKGSGKPSVSYPEAVEEALCFGWIDSKPNKIDDERYMQVFSPRKAKSAWAKPNKIRIERLIETGLMTPAGFEKIKKAKLDGSWTLLDAIEELIMPAELAAAFLENEDAHGHFEKFPASAKKMIYWQVETAKRSETRAARVKEVVRLAAENVRAFQYVKK